MSNFHEQFKKDGFVLVKGGIPSNTLTNLQVAVEPLIENRGEKTRYQTLLEPKHFHRAYIEFLNLPNLANVVTEVLKTKPSFMGLAVLLGAFETSLCTWHRDFPDDHPDTLKLLEHHSTQFIQYNCALYDDQSLWVIPGSHSRHTTVEEKEYVKSLNHENVSTRIIKNKDQIEHFSAILSNMPGAINVKLNAGDCLLYNSQIWHGALYKPEWKRATLHGGWKDPQLVEQFESMRWGLEQNPWLADPSYMGDLGSFFGPSLEKFLNFMHCYV